jgi:hypothetical protein
VTSERAFAGLMARATASSDRFGHREHLRLAWLAVQAYGPTAAVDLVSDGIRALTAESGEPQRFHATLTRAWVECVGSHVAEAPGLGFDAFVAANPALLDPSLLLRFWSAETLGGDAARAAWVEPDRAPLPR